VNRSGDRTKLAGPERGLRVLRIASPPRILRDAQSVGLTILEMHWTAAVDSLAIATMLPAGSHRFKQVDKPFCAGSLSSRAIGENRQVRTGQEAQHLMAPAFSEAKST
jgi:hypothetical protein